MFQLLRHGVKSLREFADFRAAHQMNALRKVTLCDGTAGFGENRKGIGDATGGENAHSNAQQDRQQSEQASRALHLVDAPVRIASRFLHDDGPVQRLYWAVSA